jgi:hypothetical protein
MAATRRPVDRHGAQTVDGAPPREQNAWNTPGRSRFSPRAAPLQLGDFDTRRQPGSNRWPPACKRSGGEHRKRRSPLITARSSGIASASAGTPSAVCEPRPEWCPSATSAPPRRRPSAIRSARTRVVRMWPASCQRRSGGCRRRGRRRRSPGPPRSTDRSATHRRSGASTAKWDARGPSGGGRWGSDRMVPSHVPGRGVGARYSRRLPTGAPLRHVGSPTLRVTNHILRPLRSEPRSRRLRTPTRGRDLAISV